MNIELMEKIAKRAEDPNYPYGNKLGAGHTAKSTLGMATNMSALGALIGAGSGVGVPGHPIKGMKYGAIAGSTILGLLGGKNGYKDGQNERHLSYLSSDEQKRLSEKLHKLQAADIENRIREQIGEIDDDEASNLYDKNIRKQDKLLNDAYARGKALMLAEKKNRRFGKKASDYLDDAVMEKEAWINTATKAVGSFMKTTGKQALLTGAKRGAALGAFNGFVNGGGTDANGNKQSRVGSAVKGALMGGAVGGVANGIGAATKTNSFNTFKNNTYSKVNDWAKTKFPSAFENKSASEALEDLYTEKLAGAGLTTGASIGMLSGAMSGVTKGYAKNGIKGAVKSGFRRGLVGTAAGTVAGALVDRIASPPRQEQQNPNATQNFNG